MKKLALLLVMCSTNIVYADKVPVNKLASVCAACHGQQGISPQPIWPNLAGQHPQYLVKQLADIQQGAQRKVPSMSALVAQMSKQDMDDLAAYYAKMPKAIGVTSDPMAPKGEHIYRGGDAEKGITACIACHGPQGTGNAAAGFPVLAGQHSAYIVLQLLAYKKGERSNDLNHIMHDISSRMSQEDMEAVAHYIEALP